LIWDSVKSRRLTISTLQRSLPYILLPVLQKLVLLQGRII
jgi:hypothetical protein